MCILIYIYIIRCLQYGEHLKSVNILIDNNWIGKLLDLFDNDTHQIVLILK